MKLPVSLLLVRNRRSGAVDAGFAPNWRRLVSNPLKSLYERSPRPSDKGERGLPRRCWLRQPRQHRGLDLRFGTKRRSAFTPGETRRSTGGAWNIQNCPRIVAVTGIRGCPSVTEISCLHKPKRIARDIEEHGFSDLQGGGRGFETLSAHHWGHHPPVVYAFREGLAAYQVREKSVHGAGCLLSRPRTRVAHVTHRPCRAMVYGMGSYVVGMSGGGLGLSSQWGNQTAVAIGGQRRSQSSSDSSVAARSSNSSSLPIRPASCTPMGSPAAVWCAGTARTG